MRKSGDERRGYCLVTEQIGSEGELGGFSWKLYS